MRALLDVNMLMALFDPMHTFHAKARSWWAANQEYGWASSPLTENGFLRNISRPAYARPVPMTEARQHLRRWAVPPRHEFWADDVSILDETQIDHSRLLGPKQITDICLLALAVRHGGRLVTLDRRIPFGAVRGASRDNLVSV